MGEKLMKELGLIKDIALQTLVYPVGIADMEGRIIFANDACIKFWGYTEAKEILGKNISEFSSSNNLLNKTVLAIQQGNTFICEDVYIREDGTPLNYQMTAKSIKSPTGNPIGIIACFINIAEKKRTEEILEESPGFAAGITKQKLMEEEIQQMKDNLEKQILEKTSELKNSQEQFRALASHLLATLEADRISIARDIHDELGSLLAAIKSEVEELVTRNTNSGKPSQNKLTPLINLLDAAFDSISTIAAKLRPGVLDHFGLIPAMEWQIQQFQMRNRIDVKHEFGIKDYTFSNNETTAVFRIFQEILTNILRHSYATKVDISFLKGENEQIVLIVKDNGIGFDMSKMTQAPSFGLMGMQERANSIGGELTFRSFPDEGTTVTLLIRKNLDKN